MQQHCWQPQVFPLDLNTPVFGKVLQTKFSHSQIYSALSFIYSLIQPGGGQKSLLKSFFSVLRAALRGSVFQRLCCAVALIVALLYACYPLIKENCLKVNWTNANRVFD